MISRDVIYIVDIEEPENRFSFNAVPNELKINRSINIDKVQAIGRNNPLSQFTGGSQKLSFQIDIWWERGERDEVVNKVNWLTGLTYADDVGKYPRVKLVCGDLFLDYEWVVSSFDATYTEFYEGNNYLPIQAYVNISLLMDVGEKDWRRTQLRDAQ